jgi:rod shape determining protein RodA
MRARNSILGPIDLTLVGLYLILLVIGWFSIFATEYNGEEYNIFNLATNQGKQMLWMGISLLLFTGILFSDKRLYNVLSYPIFGLVILLLVVVLVIGQTIAGNKSWIDLGFFKLQPSEFAKIATALALARYLSEPGIRLVKARTRMVAMAIIGVPFIMVILQEDVGSALVFAAFVFVLNREGLSDWVIYAGLILALLSVLALTINNLIIVGIITAVLAVIYLTRRRSRQLIIFLIVIWVSTSAYLYTVDYLFDNILQPHQQQRINVLLGKEVDNAGASYNVNQSKIAIGSGGLLGKGYLQGTQTRFDFVPEMSTDFIFCSIGEEWGLVGSVVLLGLYTLLLMQLLFLADRQRNAFNRIYMYAVAAIIFMHVFINIGMTIGVLPVIGIPLPFLSYGGSSLMSFTAMIAIAIRLDSDRLMSAHR